jgi:hypothetical protein
MGDADNSSRLCILQRRHQILRRCVRDTSFCMWFVDFVVQSGQPAVCSSSNRLHDCELFEFVILTFLDPVQIISRPSARSCSIMHAHRVRRLQGPSASVRKTARDKMILVRCLSCLMFSPLPFPSLYLALPCHLKLFCHALGVLLRCYCRSQGHTACRSHEGM